jgi:hypothetical protein
MATKPTIAGWEWEYDSSTPSVGDGIAIGTWVDSKPGGGTNAVQSQGVVRMGLIGGPNQWSDDENGIIFDGLDGPSDTMTFNPANMLLSSITLFAVIETTDVSLGCAIIGTPDGINPETGIYLCVYPDGSIHFIIGKNGAVQHRDIGSAAGLFVDGSRAFITARLDTSTSIKTLILRVNGVEVASFSGTDLGSDFWFGPRIGQANLTGIGNITGENRNMPYIGGYSTAASDAEVAAMESYLFDRFVRVFTIWTPFPPVGLQSPSIEEANGVTVGVTDFSEFAEQLGVLPSGITAYGISNTPVTTVGIVDDPQEGHYFLMDGQGFKGFGYGLDAFDGLMGLAGGELLARVWLEIPVNGRKLLGPAASMKGFVAEGGLADFDHWCGALFRLTNQLSGAFTTNNGSSSNSLTDLTQEAWQDGAWVWVRVRRVQNDILPATQDDWTITAWHGALADEPAVPDGEAIGVVRSVPFADDAIGWAMPGNAGAETQQRIAFLSFSSDPSLLPPPTELIDDRTPWASFPPVGPVSGALGEINGAIVGASDFSEFPLANGLPAGITEYGIGAGSPTDVAIVNDPLEGNYFEMTGMANFQAVLYGFGIDSFDGQIEFGELLARVWLNINTDLQWGGGPCFRLSGLIGEPSPDMQAGGSTIRRDDSGPGFWDAQANETRLGTVFVNINNVNMQELPQNGAWLWIRLRNTANLAFPDRDDWQVTAWHGALADEPASPDGTVTTVTPSSRNGKQAIGWWALFAGTAEQRIAFLSFTSDPLLAPPPTDILEVRTPWSNIPAVSPGTSWANTTP